MMSPSEEDVASNEDESVKHHPKTEEVVNGQNGEEQSSESEDAGTIEVSNGHGESGNESNSNVQANQEEQNGSQAEPTTASMSGPPQPPNTLAEVTSDLSRVDLSKSRPKIPTEPLEVNLIPIGEPGVRYKLRFDVVTARVVEAAGKKHVSYTIMMKRVNCPIETHSVVLERRYSDFCYVYESILKNFHPSILGDFLFPKKVLIGNFKAEVIAERTEAFHKFLNLIANCDNLLYSDYFYSFLSSEEYNEAVSHIKLSRYEEAVPLLENIFYVREKLLTINNIHVLQCLCELIATLAHVGQHLSAHSYALVAAKSFDLLKAEALRVPFLKLAVETAKPIGHDPKPFEKQLAELRYKGVKIDKAMPLLDIIRERYIHRASHTAKIF